MKTPTNNLLTQFNLNRNKVMKAMPASYDAFKAKIEASLKLKDVTDDDSMIAIDDNPYEKVNDIAVLSFQGFTVNNCSPLDEIFFGVVSLQGFCDDLQAAINDESINTVIVDMDSGGGFIGYGDETCELVKKLSQIKPIYFYSSGLMASMAYEIACCGTNLIASPTSLIGAVGTYCEYLTFNGASELSSDGITVSNLADMGITMTTFQAGTQKTIGSEFIALSKEQKSAIMADIKEMGNAFKQTVIANRGSVKDEFMQGQAFYGKEAMQLNTNLIDGNINSLKEFIGLLVANKQ